jgi:hypothetical protein
MAGAKRLLDDLLNLEVNTIVKTGMTGRKMPALGHALIDIFSDYDSWLCRHGGPINEQWSAFLATPAAGEFLDANVANGRASEWWIVVGFGAKQTDDGLRAAESPRHADGYGLIDKLDDDPLFDADKDITDKNFDRLRRNARIAEEMYGVLDRHRYQVETGDDVMLRRILRNCDQLREILEKSSKKGQTATLSRSDRNGARNATADSLTAEDVITIRKAWEMGTEVVVLQTVVQLDGDIVTRVNEAFVAQRYQTLRDLHREGVANALEHWQFLVTTVESVVTSGLGRLTGRS